MTSNFSFLSKFDQKKPDRYAVILAGGDGTNLGIARLPERFDALLTHKCGQHRVGNPLNHCIFLIVVVAKECLTSRKQILFFVRQSPHQHKFLGE